jgi:Ala-tRNA(Pro) deacylase
MTTCLDHIQTYLAENGVHAEIEHHYETFTAQSMAAAVHEKGGFVAKVFIAFAEGDLVMFVLPATFRVDLSRAKELLGCETVRRALEAEFSRVFPDCEIGAMPPFGNLYDLPVYLERGLASQPYLVFAAGTHRDTIRMATADYVRLVAPAVADFAIHGPERAAATSW